MMQSNVTGTEETLTNDDDQNDSFSDRNKINRVRIESFQCLEIKMYKNFNNFFIYRKYGYYQHIIHNSLQFLFTSCLLLTGLQLWISITGLPINKPVSLRLDS